MTSRERVALALSHQEPDRVPLDLGSSAVTGIMVTTYAKLRARLGVNSVRVEVVPVDGVLVGDDVEVVNAIHNIQAKTPVDNVLAMYETARDFGRYPIAG